MIIFQCYTLLCAAAKEKRQGLLGSQALTLDRSEVGFIVITECESTRISDRLSVVPSKRAVLMFLGCPRHMNTAQASFLGSGDPCCSVFSLVVCLCRGTGNLDRRGILWICARGDTNHMRNNIVQRKERVCTVGRLNPSPGTRVKIQFVQNYTVYCSMASEVPYATRG